MNKIRSLDAPWDYDEYPHHCCHGNAFKVIGGPLVKNAPSPDFWSYQIEYESGEIEYYFGHALKHWGVDLEPYEKVQLD